MAKGDFSIDQGKVTAVLMGLLRFYSISKGVANPSCLRMGLGSSTSARSCPHISCSCLPAHISTCRLPFPIQKVSLLLPDTLCQLTQTYPVEAWGGQCNFLHWSPHLPSWSNVHICNIMCLTSYCNNTGRCPLCQPKVW